MTASPRVIRLIDIDRAKSMLGVLHNDDDPNFDMLVDAASLAVLTYLKSGADDFLDDEDNVVIDDVPELIKAATVMMVGYLFRLRDEDPDKEYEMGYLPRPVMCLLYQFRDPAMA